jgi:hypothetical protein
MKNRLLLILMLGLLHGAWVAFAQQSKSAEDIVFERVEKAVRLNAEKLPPQSPIYSKAISTHLYTTIVLYRAVQKAETNNPPSTILAALQEARTDQQVGAGSTNSGSTSLVMKGGVPSILGLAVENGAFDRSISGTTVTFRGSPVGMIKALEGQNLIQMHGDLKSDPTLMSLAKLSFAFSFDTSRGDTSGTFLANKQQLSSYSFRYEAINRRDPRDRRYDELWTNKVIPLAESYTDLADSIRSLMRDKSREALNAWYAELIKICESFDGRGAGEGDLKEFRSRFKAHLDKLTELPEADRKALDECFNKMERALTKLIASRDEIRQLALKGPLVTFEFTNTRDPKLPDLYNLRLIAETRIGSRADFTSNIAASFFRTGQGLPANSGKWRDLHAAAQIDIPLGNFQTLGSFVLSLAGRWEYLPNDTRTPSTINLLSPDSVFADASKLTTDSSGTVITPKGNIGIFQAKLTIPVKGSGVKVPISFSASNRSELIKEKDVRLGVGVTFNLDTLFSK